ncbi:MAG: UbiX family flavin prenyltransferase [Bradyrhizobium sp.]|uniref:UbiX family flavin prenyltransferase n=1 Tax=Bradyrhizobium sp. TaxID=376 RepID=UPI001DDC799D|nr:UbiX family flavin prenyltransferase [Bradyrhizobium sp.]MBV9559666.1 UbiX family flavin prenyltransferase [Bradyrhizobium sp.]
MSALGNGADRHRRPLVIGISGASGVVYGVRLLESLRELQIETHLVMTKAGEMTAAYEHPLPPRAIRALSSVHHPVSDIAAPIASGSFRTMGMIVAPCSMRTLAEIASGATSNLLTRAADVCLKERRRLVLLVRETPLHAGHLRAMLAVTEMGGIIVPPVPAFYAKPASLEEMVDYTVGRVLDLFELDTGQVQRWNGMRERQALGENGKESAPWT